MPRNTLVFFALFAIASWGLFLVYPRTATLSFALSATVTGPAFLLGDHLRRTWTPPEAASLPDALGFPVKRRSMAALGVFLILIGTAGLLLLVLSSDKISERSVLLAIPILVIYGASLILASRNVREIRVTDHHIQFLPVGNVLALDEIVTIKSPPAGSAPKSLELVLRSDRRNYVPGALWQWGQTCALNVAGCDSNALFTALKERLTATQAA